MKSQAIAKRKQDLKPTRQPELTVTPQSSPHPFELPTQMADGFSQQTNVSTSFAGPIADPLDTPVKLPSPAGSQTAPDGSQTGGTPSFGSKENNDDFFITASATANAAEEVSDLNGLCSQIPRATSSNSPLVSATATPTTIGFGSLWNVAPVWR